MATARATKKKKLPPYVMVKGDDWYVRRRFKTPARDKNDKIIYIAVARLCGPKTTERAKELSDALADSYAQIKERKAIQTLAAHIERFLLAKKTTVAAKTLQSYTWLYEKHIKGSPLDAMDIGEIKPLSIQDHFQRIPTPKLVKKVHTLLSMAFQQAIRWELIEKSPCRGLIIPRTSKPAITVMSQDQARKFMAVCFVKYPALALALETGMRPGELLALRWSDVDLVNGAIAINRSVSFVDGFTYTPTKTGKGRIIEIGSSMRMLLADLKTKHVDHLKALRQKRKRKLLAAFTHHDLVFSSRNGTPIAPRNLGQREMKQACIDAGIPHFSLYSLRHTSLSMLVAAGVNIKSVSERAGHSSAQITLDIYSHVMPSIKSGAVETLTAQLY